MVVLNDFLNANKLEGKCEGVGYTSGNGFNPLARECDLSKIGNGYYRYRLKEKRK